MEIAVDFASGSGPAFRRVVSDTVADLPPRVAAELATGGVRVVAGKRLTDSCPDLMNQRPPGYPDDADYTNVRGVANLSKPPTVYIAQTYRPVGRTRFRAVENVPGVLRHELGHAYDALRGAFRSSTPTLRGAYGAGLARVREGDKAVLAYFLQEGSAGAQELFAEAFGIVTGGGAAPYAAAAIKRTFPEFLAETRRLMRSA